jgi:ubiquinol-cytochrome c reductase cytochrome c subunit
MTRAALILVLTALLAPAAHAGSTPKQGVVTGLGNGASLYAANCSRCHGVDGSGKAKQGPSLKEAGALGADFYLRTGYMPLEEPSSQPSRSRVLFAESEIRAMTRYVASLGHGPGIPHPQWQNASVPAGQKLFTDHCAGCHQIVGEGGYVTGARVPPLDEATPRQIAEAVRIGPYLMPRFSKTQITAGQLNDVIAYVEYAKKPDDRGGFSLGHLGPYPEGMVTWLVAAAVLVAMCTVLGRRFRRQ